MVRRTAQGDQMKTERQTPVPEPARGHDVFVSYSRADREAVVELTEALAARGKRAWVDLEDIPPSAEWMAEIHSAIESSHGYLVVISPDLARSQVCAEEFEHARAAGKRIVPVLVRTTDPSSVPPTLASLNWIDATDGELEASAQRIVQALETDLNQVRAHTRLLVRATEWDGRHQPRSLLLRGEELKEAEATLRTAQSRDPAPTPLQARFVQASRHGASLRQRSAVAIAICIVVPIVLTGVTYVRGVRIFESSVFDRLRAAAEQKTDAINRWLDEQFRNVQFLVALPDIRQTASAATSHDAADPAVEGARRQLRGHLSFLVANMSDAQELMVLDLEGTIVVSTVPAHEGTSQVDEDYFTQGSFRSYIQPIHPSELTGKPTITVGTPLFDGEGRQVGVLAANLDLERLDRIMRNATGLGASGRTYLIDSEHHLVGGLGAATLPPTLSSTGIDAALAGTSAGSTYDDYHGVEVVGVYRWLPSHHLALLAEMHRSEALAPARQLAGLSAVVGVGVVALAGIGGLFVARRIARRSRR
jgi:hypothetical protein